ncbi:MAG: peptidoglycan DD-metalloendopeptidase family protein, partial [Bacteroidota bacterium]|nr:peptidoglycan DD-metalloendopeptidase family protein [Bacteroidota bacterium]
GRVITDFANSKGTGINIEAPEGAAIRAAENGQVIYVGSGVEGYGNLVLIRHPNGYVSAYAHLKEMSVQKGDVVNRGDSIGAAGMTGSVSRPQLHFELRKGATPVDPVADSAKPEGQKTALSDTMPDKKTDSSPKVFADTLTIKPGKPGTTQSTLTAPGNTDSSGQPADSPELVKPQSGKTVSNFFNSPGESENSLFSKALSLAREQRINLGFKGGLNKSRINATDNDGSKSGYIGLELYGGFFADTRLTSKFNLGTELIFSFTESFHFIELPFHLKYNIKEKWNVMAGPKLDFIADGTWDYEEDKFKRFGLSAEIGSQYKLNQLFFVELKYAYGLTPQIKSMWMSFYDGHRNTIRFGLGVNFGKNEAFGKVSKELG